MSLIRHHFFPRSSLFDSDMWLRNPATSLDLFDPFDDLDRMIARNFQWLNFPNFLSTTLLPRQPRVPNKYRISVDCTGYSPKSIKIDASDDKKKLIVRGREGDDAVPSHNNRDDDFSLRQFQKTFRLPENVELDKMASFMTFNSQLVIEIPLKQNEEALIHNQLSHKFELDDHFPRIVDAENNSKEVVMNMNVPHGIDPSKIKVTCKDRDLIVQAEDKQENPDQYSQTYYYRRCTLPENTDFNSLKCTLDSNGNKLRVQAPLQNINSPQSQRDIPIEYGGNNGKAAAAIEHKK
jgi:HSP20 family molecular chaperone IbpA